MRSKSPFLHLLGSVSFKVAAFAVGLVIIILIITGGVATRYSFNTTMTYVMRESEAAMIAATKTLNERLERVENATHFIADRTYLITNDPTSAYEPLQELLIAYPDIATAGIMFCENYYPQMGREYAPIAYWDSTKQNILITNSIDKGFTYLDSPEETNWIAGTQGKSLWCEPFVSPTSNAVRIAYSVPLYSENGDRLGILCLCMDIDWLGTLLEECNPHNDGTTAAVSSEGTVLYSQNPSLIMRANIMDLANQSGDTAYIRLANDVMQGRTGTALVLHPNPNIVYFRHVPSTDWTFFFIYPKDGATAAMYRFYRRMGLIFLLAIVVLFFLLSWGIFHIIQPFSRNLKSVSENNARIGQDLKIASILQQRMLPEKPEDDLLSAIDIAGILIPARSIGGDIYDYFRRGDKLVFCIGDVSGKGVAASLFMVVVRTLLHEITRWELRPDRIMQRMNVGLLHTHSDNMFCTMFLCVMDIQSGHIAYCNAGHNPPILYRNTQDGGETTFMQPHIHLPLGVEESVQYQTDELVLAKGDGLFLYTDGVTEAENTATQQFGEAATLQTLQIHYDTSRQVVDALLQAVRNFSAGAEQSDDITMLCIKYK